MVKRVVIAGCRDYENYEEARKFIDIYLSKIRKENQIIIVSGCARGTDLLGERYAEENGFNIEKYPAEWSKFGRCAGPIRNKKMAEIADFVIAFWDGKSRGTKSMIDLAKEYKKPIKIKRI